MPRIYIRNNLIHFLLILGITLSFLSPALTKAQACEKHGQGDTNCDGSIDLIDFEQFRTEYLAFKTGTLDISDAKSNFNNDLSLDLLDFELFRTGYIAQRGNPTNTPTATTTPRITNTPTATVTTTQQPTATVGPTVTIGPSKGVWISPEEIMKLPMSGGAWDKVVSASNSNVSTACLYDNNCDADVNTLAIALVAVRKNDSALRAKAVGGLQAAMKSSYSRALELSRGLQTYIIAADIIGYHDPAFESWVRSALVANVSGHSGATGVYETAMKSSNNWGGHARASVAAAAIYLNDAKMKTDIVNAEKAFIGLSAPNQMVYTSTDWHAGSPTAGVNVKGATKNGKNISGALPEDWRRATNFQWPPAITGYMWEGMQGFVVAAVILHRAGLLPFNSGDNAVVRAMDALYGTGEAAANSPVFKNPASGDDTWIPWVVNYYGGTSYPTQPASAGKNMGWTDWMNAR